MISQEELIQKNEWWSNRDIEIREAVLAKRDLFETIQKSLYHPLILNIVGLRRVGKSTMLKQIIASLLKEKINPRNIFYFVFDYASQIKKTEFLEEVLDCYFNDILKITYTALDEKVYIFLDEIQYINNWQAVLKKYYDLSNKNIKFIITGSQSVLLKGKYRESLAGRIFDYYLPPLTFREFLRINNEEIKLPSTFDLFDQKKLSELFLFDAFNKGIIKNLASEYIIAGQFPETRSFKTAEEKHEYIMESVIGKVIDDCIHIFKIEKTEEFKLVAFQLLNNISSVFELSNIGDEVSVARVTLENYFEYLKESFIVEVLYRYHKSLVKRGRMLKKIYAPCGNFFCAINHYKERHIDEVPEAFGKLIENLVYNTLAQKYKSFSSIAPSSISFWRKGEKEIDFIVIEEKKQLAVEVKFGNKIGDKNFKILADYVKTKKLDFGIVVTKNEMSERKIDGQKIYFIPYYLVLLMV